MDWLSVDGTIVIVHVIMYGIRARRERRYFAFWLIWSTPIASCHIWNSKPHQMIFMRQFSLWSFDVYVPLPPSPPTTTDDTILIPTRIYSLFALWVELILPRHELCCKNTADPGSIDVNPWPCIWLDHLEYNTLARRRMSHYFVVHTFSGIFSSFVLLLMPPLLRI